MAEKRMFSNKITQSDPFLSMPATTQNLYWHLSMDADDDGFVNRPRAIMRMINASEDDMNLLIAKKFVIPFEVQDNDSIVSMICVIKHWFINNNIRNDRKKPTTYVVQRGMLELEENGAYTLLNKSLQPSVNQVSTECPASIEYCSVLEGIIDQYSTDSAPVQPRKTKWNHKEAFEDFWSKYPKKVGRSKALTSFKSHVQNEDTFQHILKDLRKRQSFKQWKSEEGRYIPNPSTYLNQSRWLDEYETEDVINEEDIWVAERI